MTARAARRRLPIRKVRPRPMVVVEDFRPDDVFVGVGELADRLGVSPRTIDRRIALGEIPAALPGTGRREWYWPDVVAWRRGRRGGAR